ncbi:hypothetical protein MPSEU_000101900 [Mayamaea pseudoterrestris]|nr:hypothetical protein MPSEU_000101900 [Mayamaea pseudoterrestris]
MKVSFTMLFAVSSLLATAVQGQVTSPVNVEEVNNHWTPPDELNVDSPPSAFTPAPTASEGLVEEPAPSPGSILAPTFEPVDQSSEAPPAEGSTSANTGGFGAGPSVAVAVGGTVLIASALFLGRRRVAENADSNSQSMGQSADAETL